jgi:hypothetical protein
MMTTCQPWTLDHGPWTLLYVILDQGPTKARSFFAVSQFQSRPLKQRRGRGVGWRAAAAATATAAAAGAMILAGWTTSGGCPIAMDGELVVASCCSSGVLLMLTTYIQYWMYCMYVQQYLAATSSQANPPGNQPTPANCCEQQFMQIWPQLHAGPVQGTILPGSIPRC